MKMEHELDRSDLVTAHSNWFTHTACGTGHKTVMSAQKPAPTVLERESIVLVTELWAYQYVVTVF